MRKIIVAVLIIVVLTLAFLFIQINPPLLGKEQACINSGGTVETGLCCQSVEDFPNTCLIGACSCAPDQSHEVKICNCGEKCFDGNACT